MKTISRYLGYASAVLSIAGLIQIQNAPISAAAPNPESCFTTTGTTSRTITNYDVAGIGCGTTVEIPSTIGGGTVVSIGGHSFSSKGLVSVSIPNTVTSIETYAFGYNQITSVVIPNSVTSIGDYAFEDNEMTSVTLSNTLTSIGDGVFYTNLLTSVTIPNTVTSIGESAFEDNKLTSIAIPSSVTSIERYTFYSNKLTSVTIPSSVTSIGQRAFSTNNLSSVTIPNSVTSIGSGAFEANEITSVTIPASVTSLGTLAFNMQSPHGSEIWDLIYGGDTSIAQAAADSIWYTQLFTANPSNPLGFIDEVYFEQTELDGQDNDWNEIFIAGGHLVNPTSAKLQFADGSNNQLMDPVELTGQNSGGTEHYTNYIASDGPSLAFPVNPWSPTPTETQAARDAVSQYYRPGSTLTYAAEAINGIPPTPTSYSFVLGASTASNERQFVYATATTSPSTTQAGGRLSETGINVWHMVAVSVGVMLVSSVIIVRKYRLLS